VVVRGAGEELHGVGLVGAAVYGALHDATEEGTSNRFGIKAINTAFE
jgi:hypothetical protein